MLSVFRKYQKYIYLLVTAVIVISFSFFGTYGVQDRSHIVDKVMFTTVNGREVREQELNEFIRFIETDAEDKALFGGVWGPNFLNDGVIKNDFLETGIAEIIVEPYFDALRDDLTTRHKREMKYKPYVHPNANFITATNVWGVVAPNINTYLTQLQNLSEPASADGFKTRVQLFSAQRRFPSPYLAQLINRQEGQYQWVKKDPKIRETNFALFEYVTLNDWFGKQFLNLVSEFIINGAIIAEQKGYEVSKSEALADLFRTADLSFRQNSQNQNFNIATVEQYFDEQLKRMGLDRSRAAHIWRQVLLFRRLMEDAGNTVIVDPFTIKKFQSFANESVSGDLYQLPQQFRFNNFRDLQKFEVYLDAVADRGAVGDKSDQVVGIVGGAPTENKTGQSKVTVLRIPEGYKSVEVVSSQTPDLVQRKYVLDIAMMDKGALQTKVGVKEAWNWEVQKDNWEKLKKEFPELGVKKGGTEQERYASLDALDDKTRSRVDAFARHSIVVESPDWIRQQLSDMKADRKEIGVILAGEITSLPGITKPNDLIVLLDKYPESNDQLAVYTQDGKHYYRISVVNSSPNKEILTFEEANQNGVLDRLLDKKLEAHYTKIRDGEKSLYQNEDGSWKPLDQVRHLVGASLYQPLLNAIKEDYVSANPKGEAPKVMIEDYAASLRMYDYMRNLRDELMKNPDLVNVWVSKGAESEVDGESDASKRTEGQIVERREVSDQFKLVKSDYSAVRATKNLAVDRDELFVLKTGDWSKVQPRANGDIAFFHLKNKGVSPEVDTLTVKVMETREILAMDAKKELVRRLMNLMEEKKALKQL